RPALAGRGRCLDVRSAGSGRQAPGAGPATAVGPAAERRAGAAAAVEGRGCRPVRGATGFPAGWAGGGVLPVLFPRRYVRFCGRTERGLGGLQWRHIVALLPRYTCNFAWHLSTDEVASACRIHELSSAGNATTTHMETAWIPYVQQNG